MTAIFAVIRCILYPKTKICVASKTRPQANEVLSKIEDDLMKNYSWGSANLCREISYHIVSTNKAIIEFYNGSYIKVVTASDSGRSARANIIIIDECRMVDKDIVDNVLRRFLTAPRHPNYLDNPKYSHLQERNKEIYMSSAWFKSHDFYQKCRSYFKNMLDDTKKYFVCGLPYQMSIKEGLLSREQIEDEMSEDGFDELKFMMEMQCLFWGDSEDSFFKYDILTARRKLKNAIFPPDITGKSRDLKIPDLIDNERRIMSVDVALMASGRHKNDASSTIINSAIPTNNYSYIANIVYLENKEGCRTEELALRIRRLFSWYKCTDLVLDTQSFGTSVYDELSKDIVDPETGELYEALSCCNDKAMAERCKVDNAPKVIWSIKANASFNTEGCTLLRSGFQNGKINLLLPDDKCDEALEKRLPDYKRMPEYERALYKMPYIQTTFLIRELINLKYYAHGTNIKIYEKSGMRKDRYSSLMYNYYVMNQLELENLRQKKYEFTMSDYAQKIKKISKKPIMY